jgi:hypothetical protein
VIRDVARAAVIVFGLLFAMAVIDDYNEAPAPVLAAQ